MHATRTPTTSRGREKHVIAMLIAPDTCALEVIVLQQVFGRRMRALWRATGGEATPYDVVLVGEETRVILPSGADVGELAPIDTMLTADTVMIPGLEDPFTVRSDELVATIREASAAGARMAAFCSGAFLLGMAGLLDRKRATTHWLLSTEFKRRFPLATLEAESLYVDDGPVHTSGGVFGTTDLAMHLLALDVGQAYANDFGRLVVTPPNRPGGQSQFMKDSLRATYEPPVESLLTWVRENIHEPLTLADLAAHEHVSERSLVRNFRNDTGMSVFDWIARERVNRAMVLLETTDYRIAEIAAMVGMGSSETLRRNFEKIVGTSATAYRSTFRTESVRA